MGYVVLYPFFKYSTNDTLWTQILRVLFYRKSSCVNDHIVPQLWIDHFWQSKWDADFLLEFCDNTTLWMLLLWYHWKDISYLILSFAIMCSWQRDNAIFVLSFVWRPSYFYQTLEYYKSLPCEWNVPNWQKAPILGRIISLYSVIPFIAIWSFVQGLWGFAIYLLSYLHNYKLWHNVFPLFTTQNC